MSGVSTERAELIAIKKLYCVIEDSLNGENAVKKATYKYLPKPNDISSTESAAAKRYEAYITRAVYYNVIRPTTDALIGQLFLRKPKTKLPDKMKVMEKDVNGEGLSIEQLIRLAANHVLPYGRCGFLADFPRTNGQVTQNDVDKGVRPFIKFYSPWAIINWRIEKRDGSQKLTLLVLKEVYEKKPVPADSFGIDLEFRYRVYRLSQNNEVTLEVWEDEAVTEPTSLIKDTNNKPLSEIPFSFVGSENNDAEIDQPPMYGLATLNIAHYRNSADYEESVFMLGQPTPVFTGLTRDWVDNYFEKGIPLGSRECIPLPEGATASLLQPEPNSMAFEAMTHKEQQMIAIGAKLINPNQKVERKEAEIQIDAGSQRSVLTTIKENLEKAFLEVLGYAGQFVGEKDGIEIELNDNFDLTSLSAEELRWLLELYVKKAIDFDELHTNLRRSGISQKNKQKR